MEFRQLKYFLSAARHQSFTEAARECCIVQSAMSQQIRALEKELNVSLFERTKHGLKLTAEGKALELEATALLKQATRLHTAVARARTDGACMLRVGCQDSLMHTALPRALAALRGDHPRISAQVKCALRQDLLSGLREGELDCALLLREEDAGDGLQSRIVSEEVLCVAISAASPLVNVENLTLEALAREPLVLCAEGMDRRLLNDRLIEFIDGRKSQFVESQSAAEVLVAAGFGVSLCVQSAARINQNIVYRVLPGLPRLHACLVWPGENPLAALSEKLASQLVIAASEIISVF